MNRTTLITSIVMSSVLSAVTALGVYVFFFEPNINELKSNFIEPKLNYTTVSNTSQAQPLEERSSAFVTAAAATTSGVVHIKTSLEQDNSQNQREELLEEFFGFRKKQNSKKKQAQGSGSGVILSSDGYIVTNNHVIENADEIEVTLYDNRTLKAKLVGNDPQTDLALLKVDANDLSWIPYGQSDDVQVGEWVLAVGNPFNLNSTVTSGIVSAKARNIRLFSGSYGIESFIQTDAAVNPGNSGGALVNLKGELIGINTAIASPNGSYAGYAFAVPVSIVKKIVADLKEYGTAQRALLGVSIRDITSELEKEKKLGVVQGVYVEAVSANGAAEKSGIEPGDVILSIDDSPVRKVAELQEAIGIHRPGDQVMVHLLRGGKKMTIEATLLNLMGDLKEVNYNVSSMIEFGGASLADLSVEKKKKMELKSGVEVLKLGNGIWKNAGIEEGFVITSMDNEPVKDAKGLMEALRYKRGGGVLIIGINPDGKEAYYALALK